MTVRKIQTADAPLHGSVCVPGSKSITNRALICASLAKGASVIHGGSEAEDTLLMVNGLNQLGVLVRREGKDLVVHGTGGRLFAPKFPIPVRNAGTTLRFLMGISSLARGRVLFEGDFRMAERPSDGLITALRTLGVPGEARGTRFAVTGGTLQGGTTSVSSNQSSQFVSSLLMVAPYAREDVVLEIEGTPVSGPYIGLTINVMHQFGVAVERKKAGKIFVRAGQRYAPAEFTVEPDASAVSYFLAAAAILGGEMFVKGAFTDVQGDLRLLDILRTMGCMVEHRPDGIYLAASGKILGVEVDLREAPDLVPTLSVMGLFSDQPVRINNVLHLRHKESDRLIALQTELRKLGANVTLHDNGLTVERGELHGGQLDTYDDHRLAMSFALIGLKVPGIIIENPECVKKSFPRFWEEFEGLRTRAERV
jgi:3-phosphoshikimate 1-carboxyvinyltransferase